MSNHRYKSEFLFWKSPYYNAGYPESVTDEQIAKNEAKAFKIDRRGRTHPLTKSAKDKSHDDSKNDRQQSSSFSVRETRLKRDIVREIRTELPGSMNICIPIRTVSAGYSRKPKQTKDNSKQNEQMNELKKDLEDMKTKITQQDELIEHLRQQLDKKDTTPPPSPINVIETVVPTMPYVEDPPSIDLGQTVWE